MNTKIYITNDQDKLPVTPALRGLIKRAVNRTLEAEGFTRGAEVSVTFTDNAKIRGINSEFRNVDSVTDVLSFPIFDEDFDDEEDAVLGDVILSLERAKEQAETFGHSFEREVAFLTVHSILHLLGYDHMEEEEEKEMRAHQNIVMDMLGLTVK